MRPVEGMLNRAVVGRLLGLLAAVLLAQIPTNVDAWAVSHARLQVARVGRTKGLSLNLAGADLARCSLYRPILGGFRKSTRTSSFQLRHYLSPVATAAQHGTEATASPEPRSLLIYDGTLTQRQAEFSVEDKIKVAQMLDDFGTHYIEAGWPTVNPADRVFFVRALDELEPQCFRKLVAMAPLMADGQSSTRVSEALLKTGAMCVGVALNMAAVKSDSEAMSSLQETLQLLLHDETKSSADRKVVVQLHNAMHAYRDDPRTIKSIVSAICRAGADLAMLVDSGGTATPWEVEEIVVELQRSVEWGDTKLGVACKEQAELAVASTLYAARQGAEVLAGTMNGFGGAVDLASLVPVLQLKMGHQLVTPDALAGLTRLSRAINEQVNLPHSNSQPFVGQSAFAHKGGIHVAAVLKNEDSYQHIDPRIVGNQRRVLISELSGRGNIMSKVEELGMLGQQAGQLQAGQGGGPGGGGGSSSRGTDWKQRSGDILKTVKDLEQKGYTFEGAEASVDLMIRRTFEEYLPAFTVESYQVYNTDLSPTTERTMRWRQGEAGNYQSPSRKLATCKAVVAVTISPTIDCYRREESCDVLDDEEVILEVAKGNGPVDALARALNRALMPSFPTLKQVDLTDYKVRILDADHATAANVRVMVDFRYTSQQAAPPGEPSDQTPHPQPDPNRPPLTPAASGSYLDTAHALAWRAEVAARSAKCWAGNDISHECGTHWQQPAVTTRQARAPARASESPGPQSARAPTSLPPVLLRW